MVSALFRFLGHAIAFLVIGYIAITNWSESLSVLVRLNPLIIAQNAGVLGATVGLQLLLWTIPPFRHSLLWFWRRSESFPRSDTLLSSLDLPVVGWVYAVLLALATPVLARWYEEIGRVGVASWPDVIGRCILAVFWTSVIGVPISMAMSLTVPMLWFGHQYFDGGTELSILHVTAFGLATILALVCWERFGPSNGDS